MKFRMDPELEYKGCCVVLREGESTDSLIKRFKKKYMKSGIPQEYRKKAFYEKPSTKRKRKKIEAYKKMLRSQSKKDKMIKKIYDKKVNPNQEQE